METANTLSTEKQMELARILNNIYLDISHIIKTNETTLEDILNIQEQDTELGESVRKQLYTLTTRYDIPLKNIVEIYLRVNKVKQSEKHINIRKIQYNKKGNIWKRETGNKTNLCGCGSHSYHYEYNQLEKDVYGVCNTCGEDIYIIIPEKKAKVIREGTWK